MKLSRPGLWCGALALVCGLVAGGPAGAEMPTPAGYGAPEAVPTRTEAMLHKLGRGLANVVTSPLELLRTPELVGRKDGYLAAITVGPVQGLWHGLQRALTGAYDALTFFVEVPEGFRPLLLPEFVWQHGDWAK